jgi:hypothetical protein
VLKKSILDNKKEKNMNPELIRMEAGLKEQQSLYGGLAIDLKGIKEKMEEVENDILRMRSRIITLRNQPEPPPPKVPKGKKKMPITDKILKDAKKKSVTPSVTPLKPLKAVKTKDKK